MQVNLNVRLKRNKMRKVLYIIFVITYFAGCVTKMTSPPLLIEINSEDYGNPNMAIKAVELERNAKISHIVITYDKGNSVGSSMFVCFTFYKIAKARNSKYFVILKECIDEKGKWVYVVGFTNKKNVDIKKEFGEEYDFYDEEGEKKELIKASFFDNIFDKKEKAFESYCAPTEKIK